MNPNLLTCANVYQFQSFSLKETPLFRKSSRAARCPESGTALRTSTRHIVALAKKAAKKKGAGKGGASRPSGGFAFGKRPTSEETQGPAELPDDAENLREYSVFVRISADAKWNKLGSVVVEADADVQAALRERRGLLRAAATSVPQVVLGLKGGSADSLEYGVADFSNEEPSDEGETTITPFQVSGK
ncbi:hypothetical protein CYMTET_32530, partial [Cymbomonas tetramitiformis]